MYKIPQPSRGDIYMANLARDPLSKKSGIRPVVIVQNNVGNLSSTEVIVVIVTSRHKKRLPTHVTLDRRHGVKRPSTALCERILTIEKSCLINYMGTVANTEAERQLDTALSISIGLKTEK